MATQKVSAEMVADGDHSGASTISKGESPLEILPAFDFVICQQVRHNEGRAKDRRSDQSFDSAKTPHIRHFSHEWLPIPRSVPRNAPVEDLLSTGRGESRTLWNQDEKAESLIGIDALARFHRFLWSSLFSPPCVAGSTLVRNIARTIGSSNW